MAALIKDFAAVYLFAPIRAIRGKGSVPFGYFNFAVGEFGETKSAV
jgi:hypothetical protein